MRNKNNKGKEDKTLTSHNNPKPKIQKGPYIRLPSTVVKKYYHNRD